MPTLCAALPLQGPGVHNDYERLRHRTKVNWMTDANGCKAANLHRQRGKSFTWSGACVAGYAEGEGVLTWFPPDQPTSTYTGHMKPGHLNSVGVLQESAGNRYEGDFANDGRDGHGVYRYAGGSYFEGEFVTEEGSGLGTLHFPDGTQIETMFMRGVVHVESQAVEHTAILNACLSRTSNEVAVKLVSSSGIPGDDEEALSKAKVHEASLGLRYVHPEMSCYIFAVTFNKDGMGYIHSFELP